MPPLPPPSPKQYSQECLNYRVIDCIKRHDEKVCTPKHWSHLQSLLWERSAYIREQSSKTGFYELFIILIWYLFAIVRSINIWRISFTLGSNVTVFGKLAFKECVCVFVCVCAFFLHVLSSLNQILVHHFFPSSLLGIFILFSSSVQTRPNCHSSVYADTQIKNVQIKKSHLFFMVISICDCTFEAVLIALGAVSDFRSFLPSCKWNSCSTLISLKQIMPYKMYMEWV